MPRNESLRIEGPRKRRQWDNITVGRCLGTLEARTAGFYQYRYGLGGADGPSVGTDAQRALLQEQRAVQTHLDNLTRAPRQAAFHNENPLLPDMSEFQPAPRPKAKAKAKSRPETWHERQMREYRRQGVSQPMGQYHGAREIN